MKFIQRLRKSYVILAAFLGSAAFAQNNASNTESPWSGLPLLEKCAEFYKMGLATYQEAVEKRLPDYKDFFSEKEKTVSEECRSDFSVGLMDARIYYQQTLLVEYLMELNYGNKKYEKDAAALSKYDAAMKKLYAQKLQMAYLSPELLDSESREDSEAQKAVAKMNLKLIEQARSQRKTVQFGRFIFTETGRPYTSFDYAISDKGEIEELPSGQLKVEMGSYQKKAEMILKSAIEVAQAYIDYRPKMVIGEDSLLTATLQEKIWGTEFKDTLRGKREISPFEAIDSLMQMSNQMHLNIKPLVEIQKHMYAKQNAMLELDVKASRAALTGLVLLPALPYAIRLGSYLLSSCGTSLGMQYVVDGAAWKLNVGAFLYTHATTISVMSSLLAAVGSRGLQVYEAIQVHKRDPKNFTMAHVFDAVLVSSLSAVPLAAAAPIFVAGGTAAVVESTSFVVGETSSFLSAAANGFRAARTMGWRTALVEAAKAAPKQIFKTWCNAWWTRGPTGIVVNTKFIAMTASFNVANVIAEYTSREMNQDPDKKFFTPNGVNKWSKYDMATTLLTSILAGPVINISNFWGRWIAYRFSDVLMNASSTLVLNGGKVDWNYVSFQLIYGASMSSAVGEGERVLQLAILKSPLSSGNSFVIQTLLKLALKYPKAILKNSMMDVYFHPDKISFEKLKELFRDELRIQLDNFTPVDIEQGIEEFQKDPEVMEIMKLQGPIH